ncbi:MAG: tRNA (N6-threonylcarbamoyladenosine(37)-N6)-methyltransferase TrmO [Alphaproteobacteria bacterium]|nr:tRNA (N6-threonylcarbamoyladenosine(37)-N6)-methyltransferase TrmO [Alphaproteobacteria bacterium]
MPRKQPKAYTDVVDAPDQVLMQPIAVVRSPFKERFGTPRQGVGPDVTGASPGRVELLPGIPADAIADLVGFERAWLITWLHLNRRTRKARVTPPRGGPSRSLLATRAPHRPNPIGLTCVRIVGVEGQVLLIEEHDLLDGTPVLDIKPYVPYADAFPDAGAGWVDDTRPFPAGEGPHHEPAEE